MPLTDGDMKNVTMHVLAEISKRRRRWVMMALAVLTAVASIQACIFNQRMAELVDQRVQETTEPIQEATDELAQRPYVAGLDTEFSQADRLVIDGTAFGSEAGSIELFYKVIPSIGVPTEDGSLGETRTQTLYLRGESIEQWTDEEIIVRTTEQERQRMLERVGEPDFADMVPYIRVVRADHTRSSVW